ncbi:hypothetical protein FGO68_gene8264 [Halteria grandinella]|uniref:Uncharacterized protein n=1 Tax=Halteria grandinella TaxID=5974 RepID=A0A8J8T7Z7_HALGN|nr:hypothetical protein FGO68_gene8264 [Halteria grandinella]
MGDLLSIRLNNLMRRTPLLKNQNFQCRTKLLLKYLTNLSIQNSTLNSSINFSHLSSFTHGCTLSVSKFGSQAQSQIMYYMNYCSVGLVKNRRYYIRILRQLIKEDLLSTQKVHPLK